MSFFGNDDNTERENSTEFYSDESIVYRINNICFKNKNKTGDLKKPLDGHISSKMLPPMILLLS